jgi:hypothetical protein
MMMKQSTKKAALAAGLSASLLGASMPSQAVIEGVAGEALLVPLVIFDPFGGLNTLINITVPSSIGFESIPNNYTATNTTPTNDPETITPAGFTGTKDLHWFFFDHKSKHVCNAKIPVTPDDQVFINWGQVVGAVCGFEWVGNPGYLVFTTETARSGAAADFNMFGEAYLVNSQFFYLDAQIPVLAMNDGADGVDPVATKADNVKYDIDGIPSSVSPLISGMRTNKSDSIGDTTLFDLTLSNRDFPTVHVVWLDQNTGYTGLNVDVYDNDERTCSDAVDLPYELNIIYVLPWGCPGPQCTSDVAASALVEPFDFEPQLANFCLPPGASVLDPGFARYSLPEYVDTNIDEPESAGVAFSIAFTVDPDLVAIIPGNIIPVESALAHERGLFTKAQN